MVIAFRVTAAMSDVLGQHLGIGVCSSRGAGAAGSVALAAD
jgi:hypothetical protein